MSVSSRSAQITRHLATLLLTVTLLGCAETDAAKRDSDAQTRANEVQNPTPEQVARMLDPNVVGVAALYDSFDPWLWSASHERPIGVVIRALYLLGPKYKGVFGDGTIRPRLFVREIDPKGGTTWKLAKEWSFSVQDAMLYRSKRQTVLGWGYLLHLHWDEISQLSGRQVRMVVEFDRIDGRRVASDKKDFRVPAANAS